MSNPPRCAQCPIVRFPTVRTRVLSVSREAPFAPALERATTRQKVEKRRFSSILSESRRTTSDPRRPHRVSQWHGRPARVLISSLPPSRPLPIRQCLPLSAPTLRRRAKPWRTQKQTKSRRILFVRTGGDHSSKSPDTQARENPEKLAKTPQNSPPHEKPSLNSERFFQTAARETSKLLFLAFIARARAHQPALVAHLRAHTSTPS